MKIDPPRRDQSYGFIEYIAISHRSNEIDLIHHDLVGWNGNVRGAERTDLHDGAASTNQVEGPPQGDRRAGCLKDNVKPLAGQFTHGVVQVVRSRIESYVCAEFDCLASPRSDDIAHCNRSSAESARNGGDK